MLPEHVQAPSAFIDELRRRFEAELAPHFAIEERELVGRCVALGEPLASLAARVVADHDALRALVASLEPLLLTSQCDAFGARLEEHVRFEEREWFPALEEHLGSDALARLAGALRSSPPSPVVALRQDDDGAFNRMPKLPKDVAPYRKSSGLRRALRSRGVEAHPRAQGRHLG